MTKRFTGIAVSTALMVTQLATPVLSQTRPAPQPQDGPQILPVPSQGGPQILPVPPQGGPQILPVPPARPITKPVPRPPIQPPVYQPGAGFAGTLRCESRKNRYQNCPVATGNRVELTRLIAGSCARGRTWGMTSHAIWVSHGCRAVFGYGYANGGGVYPQPLPEPLPQPDKDHGPSTGAIIAGVVVAGGLIALLASKKKSPKPEESVPSPTSPAPPATFPAGPPAALSVDLSSMPSASRASVQNCMFDAARQIGVTGGTKLRYDRTVSLEPGNGGWRVRAAVTATYPDGERALEMYCRATPTKIVQLDFT